MRSVCLQVGRELAPETSLILLHSRGGGGNDVKREPGGGGGAAANTQSVRNTYYEYYILEAGILCIIYMYVAVKLHPPV